MYATYQTIEELPTLRFERRLAHPVEKVWQAITEPEQLNQWFPSVVELELRAGAPINFTFPEGVTLPEGVPTTMIGEVVELEPPTLFAFYWGEDRLTFELEPAEEGSACRLRFTVVLDARDKAARDAAGWHVCLDALQRLLDGQATQAPGTGPTNEWQTHYDEYQRRGVPSGAWLPGS
jgi:uncharacterized protein YndB with AHSA1/START domain